MTRGEKPPEFRRASVTENRPLTTGENRGHPPALAAQRSMAHRVDASMDPVEAAGLNSAIDAP
jgi:hypothetical protein